MKHPKPLLLLLIACLLPVPVYGQEETSKAKRNKTALPRVLVIGDELYNEPTRTAAGLLRGRVQLVYGKHAIYNSTAALAKFDKLLDGKQWDLIHFNFGFNDLMHKDPASYVESRDFWPQENERDAYRHPSHDRWYDNAESFYLMGEAIGENMLKLLKLLK